MTKKWILIYQLFCEVDIFDCEKYSYKIGYCYFQGEPQLSPTKNINKKYFLGNY